MAQLICFFSPAFLAVAMLQRIQKKAIRGWNYVTTLAISAGVINMLSAAVLAIFFGRAGAQLRLIAESFDTELTYKYLALSFAFALVLPWAFDFLRRMVRIELVIQMNPEVLKEYLAEKTEEVGRDEGKE